MSWLDTFRTGFDSVRSNRLRSALTMLGILIGISAVILTVGLGQGAQAQVRSEINALGTNLLVVSPGSSTSTSTVVRGGFGTSSTLTQADAAALASKVVAPDIEAVAPTQSTSTTLTAGTTTWTTTLVGTTPSWSTIRSRTVTSGRFLTAADMKNDAAVTVLGPDTATELFSGRNAVGQTVAVDDIPLQVVGVLASVGSTGSSDSSSSPDDQALVPLSTLTERLVGGTNRNSVSSIYVKATSSKTLSAAYQEANSRAAGSCTGSAPPAPPTSASPPRTRSSPRPPRSTTPSPSCSGASPPSPCWSAASG